MHNISYDRETVVEYARKWALARNPIYYDYDSMGGDCTNFVSQCIYAGIRTMNYTKDLGWYYKNPNQKAPAWTGVPFLHQFLTSNQGVGPFGVQAELDDLEIGDIIQLSFDNIKFAHSTVLTKIIREPYTTSEYYVCAHDYDVYEKNLNDYQFMNLRGIHLNGGRVAAGND